MRSFYLALIAAIVCLAGCSKTPTAAQSNGPVLVKLFPSSIVVGEKFNVQPDGTSTLALACKNVTFGAVVVFGNRTLPAALNNQNAPDCLMSATILPDILSQPGAYPVYIRDSKGESNRVDFVIRPR